MYSPAGQGPRPYRWRGAPTPRLSHVRLESVVLGVPYQGLYRILAVEKVVWFDAEDREPLS